MKEGAMKYTARTLLSLALLGLVVAGGWAEGAAERSTQTQEGPIVVTTVRSTAQDVRFAEGETWNDNAIYDAYEEATGFRVENLWAVDESQYDQRVQLTIASGDIPDFFRVTRDSNAFPQLIQAGLLADLTEIWDEHASEDLKEFVTADGGFQFSLGVVAGDQMAIPETGDFLGGTQNLWIRVDWLDELGLDRPKTIGDVVEISNAFATQDPNGNGEQDEYGLGVVQDFLTNGVYGLKGFFNGFDAYPGNWILRDNRLEYGSIQPEAREALAALQAMFANGEIDPEFGVKDPGRENELAVNDQLGMVYGAWWMAAWPLKSAAVQDDAVVQAWEPVLLPSKTAGKPANIQLGPGFSSYWVVSRESDHPEAMIELMNERIKWHLDPDPENPEVAIYEYGAWGEQTDPANNNWKLNPVQLYPQYNSDTWSAFFEALRERDRSIIENVSPPSPWHESKYDAVVKYADTGEGRWQEWVLHKVDGSQHSKLKHFESGRFVTDRYYGPPTKTMASRAATLQAREIETFTMIIMGEADLDEFDEFVDQWHDLGGLQITEEVNDWYTSMQ
jgi:putative aldouronate transport system substrate-binding protein